MAIEAGSSTYYQAKRGIVQDGLVLHLDAGVKESYNGGNVWRDLSGNGNNGSIVNGVINNKVKGGSFSFDGVNDYINLPAINVSDTANTVCAWVTSRYSGDATKVIYGPDTNGRDNYLFTRNNRLRLGATQSANFNNFSLRSDIPIDSTGNTWYYVCSTINDNLAKLYVNGTLQISDTRSFTIGSWKGTAAIGRRGALNAAYYQGEIALVSVYDCVLSASEVLQNYNATRHRFGL